MYLTPIFYPLDLLSETLQYWIQRVNPMYIYITQFRDLVLFGKLSSLSLIIRGLFFALLMLFIGIWRFKRNEDRFILYI